MSEKSRKRRFLTFSRVEFLAILALLLGVCAVYALSMQESINFMPINGTYQNFNPIRRLLSGQVPYRDFIDYLGLGHLLLGGLFTWLWGGDYAASLSGFTFATVLSVALTAFVLAHALLKSKRASLCLATILLVLALWVNMKTQRTLPLLSEVLRADNSTRMLRGAAPVFMVLMLLAAEALARRFGWLARLKEPWKTLAPYLACGLCGGAMFSYSNDYGISSWLCFGLMAGVIALAQTKKVSAVLLRMGAYFAASAVGLVLFVLAATGGNLVGWLQFTFGTGGYQSWYYIAGSSLFLYEVDFDFTMLLQAVLVLIYLVQIVLHKGSYYAIHRFGIPAVLNMTGFCAANEYKLLSGGERREAALLFLLLTLLLELLRPLLLNFHKLSPSLPTSARSLPWAAAALACVYIGSAGLSTGITLLESHEGTYFSNLGGRMTELDSSILDAETFLDGKTVFSTYASALEADTGQFQPSKYDYIIHVLGDGARAEYLDTFHAGGFDYVTTIKREYSPWEYWIVPANWFFYEELYRGYHPVFSNEYQIFWAPNEDGQTFEQPGDTVKVSVERISNSSARIILQGDPSLSGFANVHVNCAAEPDEGLRSKLMIHSMVTFSNTAYDYMNAEVSALYDPDEIDIAKILSIDPRDADNVYARIMYDPNLNGNRALDSHNLPSGSDTTIPVEITNGYGEVTVTSVPASTTTLSLSDVYCDTVYTVFDHFIDDVSIVLKNQQESLVVVPNTARNQDALLDARALLCGGQEIEITSVRYSKEGISLNVHYPAGPLLDLLDGQNCVQVLS